MAEHTKGRRPQRLFSTTRVLVMALAIAGGVLMSSMTPNAAQSQISSKVIKAPDFSAPSHAAPAHKPKLPKAPKQVELPPPAPTKIMPGLWESLVATGPVTEPEGKDLDAALKAFHEAPLHLKPGEDYSDYARPLAAFAKDHPNSNWNAAIYTNLGLGYFHDGYFSKAFDALAQAWQLGKNASNPQAHLMIDRAVGELAKLHARVGHAKELDALLSDVGKRPMGGPGLEFMQHARADLATFKANPGVSYLCGPQALKNVLTTIKASPKQVKIADNARSGVHGFSLEQLAQLADKAKVKYTLIHREAGQPVPVPSVVNWNVHHYAAITGRDGTDYHIKDPTFGDGFIMTPKAIDAEASGYFLVPESVMAANKTAGWRVVGKHSAEAKAAYGMGLTSYTWLGMCMACSTVESDYKNDGFVRNYPNTNNNSCSQPSCINTDIGDTQVRSLTSPMTTASATKAAVNLHLQDTLVGYKPQVGATAQFTTISYNQREDELPATIPFSNLSPNWSHSWMIAILDDPVHPSEGMSGYGISRLPGGGGGVVHLEADYSSGTWAADTYDQSAMTRKPTTGAATSYTRTLADGTVYLYSTSDGATSSPRYMFLTSITDPQGNVTTLSYDSSHRITSVTDPMGRSTTFTYGLSGYPLLITEITDAFSRTTQMTYDTSERLSTVTDPVGITSTYTYSATETTFVTNLATPYGTSTYNDTPNPNDTVVTNMRSLTLTDPLGYTDYLYYLPQISTSIVPSSVSSSKVPTGVNTNNADLEYRNTFYWNKHQSALGCTFNSSGEPQSETFSDASITHFTHFHNAGNQPLSDDVESYAPPLENRIWFSYAGQSMGGGSIQSGTYYQPEAQGRVLDDGTTQLYLASYNTYGSPTLKTDPLGRKTQYNYDTNNIDLLTVKQLTTTPSTYTTIATYGSYTSGHRPQSYTDAAGQSWSYGWNSAGQIHTITDPSSNVTTYNYDSSGRLSTVVNANSDTVLTLTYDSADRIYTREDSEGYTLTYTYDDIDRITSITYPDGTTDLYDYTFQSGTYAGTASLELRKYTDRLGRVTTYAYDADRRLTSVTEPITGSSTRTTSYDYYEDGTLKDIIDAGSNDTRYAIDVESRPTSKTYAYGTLSAQTETYTYETTTSRLKSVTDALSQVKTLAYAKDNRVTGLTYTSSVNTTPNVTFAYDTYFPRMTSMTDGTGTTDYSYTAIGTNGALKMSSIAGPYSNDTIGLTYDALGRLSGRTITGGNGTFGYDAISRMTSHGTPLGSFTEGYLGQTNQMTSQSVTNGSVTVSTGWSYDTNTNDRRLIGITNSGVTRSYTIGYGSGPVNVYDIMSITDTAAAGHPWATQSRAYTYDEIDRLLTASATTPGNDTYAYDYLDNATTWNTPASGSLSPTFNVVNQLATWGSNTYSFDAAGNTLSGDGTRTYKWDAENRLLEIDYVGTSNKSVFTYNGIGQRVADAETVSSITTTNYYEWCGSRICQTRNSSQTAIRRDLPEGEYNVSSGQMLVYMPDQLGSVRDVIDASTGNLVQSYDYTPYGAVAETNGSTATDYQYAGLFLHPASDLNLAAYRAQDGITGRWIGRDPIKELGGINLYGYVRASPVNWLDYLGLDLTPAIPYQAGLPPVTPPSLTPPPPMVKLPESQAIPQQSTPTNKSDSCSGNEGPGLSLPTGPIQVAQNCDGPPCSMGGSYGTSAMFRIGGRNLCWSCAVKELGIQDLPASEQLQILQRYEIVP